MQQNEKTIADESSLVLNQAYDLAPTPAFHFAQHSHSSTTVNYRHQNGQKSAALPVSLYNFEVCKIAIYSMYVLQHKLL